MARKHPFHWDAYNAIYDRLEKVIDTEDRRLYPEVRKALVRARAEVYRAWDLQASLERDDSGRFGARPSSDDRRGGPTITDPDRPYCKPDQSCCDFTCGN